jgi:hypothetical protein
MIMSLQADVDRMQRRMDELQEEVARVRERILEKESGRRADLVPLRSVRIFPWLKSSG